MLKIRKHGFFSMSTPPNSHPSCPSNTQDRALSLTTDISSPPRAFDQLGFYLGGTAMSLFGLMLWI